MKLKLYAIAYGALALSVGGISTKSVATTAANLTPSTANSFVVSMFLCVRFVYEYIIVCLTTSSRKGIMETNNLSGSKSLTQIATTFAATSATNHKPKPFNLVS